MSRPRSGAGSAKAVRVSARDTERFWHFVDKTPGCWLWTGYVTAGRNGGGYGRFYTAQPKDCVAAHRASFAIANGGLCPAGGVVMHSCDNPRCVNPAHLTLSTQRENVRDAVAKGRATGASPRREYAERLRQEDAIKYLDYMHANLCGFATAMKVGPLPLDFEAWRKARYSVVLSA